jgi:hypothetical protein
MKMLGTAHQAFVEADLAYRRERIAAQFGPGRSDIRRTWVHRLREVFRNRTDLRSGAPRSNDTRPIAQPGGWNATNHPRVTPAPHH